MTSRRRLSFWSVLGGLLALGFLGLCTWQGESPQVLAANADKPAAAAAANLPPEWVKTLHWRCIGPANMSGRITAISVFEADPTTYWVATASGGLLKTVNNGITFEHQFDRESTVSIGDVCVAPTDRNIVWVGTGENNPRNSVSYGDGVYKSTDGGKTWKNMGLKKSFQIGKILVHPSNPDIVYVGALGRLYGPSEERGLFKTTNGGESWQKILYVDDRTGVLDMRMNPADPQTLLVATWERQRDGFDSFFGNYEGDQYGPIKNHTPGTALYRTTDGGQSFKKVTQGLPTVKLGRIGLDWYRKDPNIVFAMIDTEKAGTTSAGYLGVLSENSRETTKVRQVAENSPAAKAGIKTGEVITEVDGKPVKGSQDFLAQMNTKRPGDQTTLGVQRGDGIQKIAVTLAPWPANAEARVQMLTAGFIGEDTEDGIRVNRLLGEEAGKAGLKEGDLITAIEGNRPNGFRETFAELSSSHKVGDKIKVSVDRAGEKKEITLVLAQSQFGRGGGAPAAGRQRPGGTVRPYSSGLGGQRENVQDQQGPDGVQTGGLFKSTDGGVSWTRINSINPRPMYFSQVRVDPSDANNLYVLGVAMARSSDGGKTFRPVPGREVHADGHALWIDPRDGRHMIIGCDGGYYVTYDRMAKWDHLNQAALGQFYHVAVDPRPLYYAYGGLQDNGSWGGPSRTRTGVGPINEDWISVGGGDGFTCRVDPNDPDVVYSTSQNGAMSRRNLKTGEVASIRPGQGRGQGQGQGQGQGAGPRYRFNWNSPFILSNRNSRIFYCAGNYVWRSLDRGNDLVQISPEITLTNKGSATALAESPRNPNVLWVGTDDGALWITRDGGKEWTEISKNVKLPGPRWVATIEPSRAVEGRAYVVFDGHRSDDDDPHVYVTEDFGQTWKSLRANLPWGSSRCLREDLTNPNLLYLGTEFAVWASLNRGESWVRINSNLPTVAVHEFALHPTAGEIVAATHGRSLWILDVAPLRQMTAEVLKSPAHLFKPTVAIRWRPEPRRGGTTRRFVGENPPSGAQIYYSLAKIADKVSLKVFDIEGKQVSELRASTAPGLHRVSWDLTRTAGGARAGGRGGFRAGGQQQQPPAGQQQAEGNEETPQQRRGPGGFGPGGQPVAPGTYRLVLTVDGKDLTETVRVEADPTGPAAPLAIEENDEDKE